MLGRGCAPSVQHNNWPWREDLRRVLDVQVKLQGAEVFVEGSGRARVASVPFLSHAPLAVGGTEGPPSVIGDTDASAARCVVGSMLVLHHPVVVVGMSACKAVICRLVPCMAAPCYPIEQLNKMKGSQTLSHM